jgi:4-hydroxy-tetrahydrodipicolinate synthase
MTITGCLPVLATPFDDQGGVDHAGLRRIIDLNVEAGADGLTCFGLASELYKLDDSDRLAILRTVVSAAGGRVPVIAGCEHSGTVVAARRCEQAANEGAGAIMLLPPSFTPPSRESLVDYFLTCAEAAKVPIVIQDAPAWTGVQMPSDLIVHLHRADSRIGVVKLEAPPIAAKAQELRAAGLTVISGFGAVHLREDLHLGVIDGFMPGCSVPELMVQLWRLASAGRLEEFNTIFDRLLPLLVAELTDLDTFIEVQKLTLVARGVIGGATSRQPHRPIEAARLSYLEDQISNALAMARSVSGNVNL